LRVFASTPTMSIVTKFVTKFSMPWRSLANVSS
jgi:hypothetical protein